MEVRDFIIKKVVTTKAELIKLDEWESFIMFYRLDARDMLELPDNETFVLDPSDAAIFNLIPHNEANKLDEFYRNQLID